MCRLKVTSSDSARVPIVPAAFITLSLSLDTSRSTRSGRILFLSSCRLSESDITRLRPLSVSARVPRIYAAFPATLQNHHRE